MELLFPGVSKFVRNEAELKTAPLAVGFHAQVLARLFQPGLLINGHSPGAQKALRHCKRPVKHFPQISRAFLGIRPRAREEEHVEIDLNRMGGSGNQHDGGDQQAHAAL